MPISQTASSMPVVSTIRDGERGEDKKRSNGVITIADAQGDQTITALHKARDRETSIPFSVTTAIPSQRSESPPGKGEQTTNPK
jgi:hypothetical protein